MSFKRILVYFVSVIALVVPAFAQQTNQTNLPPTQLALEVTFYPNVAPGYQVIHPDKRGDAWWGRFAQISGWKQPPDSLPVTAVRIRTELAEEGVRIWVSVYLGEMHEQEKDISSYLLHEREQQTVRELEGVGVTPFEMKLVRVNLAAMEAPRFTSKAKSIELVSIRPVLATMPSFEVVLRNVSNKNVNAFRTQILQSGRARIIGTPQGEEGQPLLPAGGTYTFTVRIATRAEPTADGFTPIVLPDQVVEIATAVFADGTFEGESEAAIVFAAFQKGRALQLMQASAVFDQALASNDPPEKNLESLRAQVSTLSFEANAAAVQEVRAKIPPAADAYVKKLIETAMKGTRDELVSDVVQFQLHSRRRDAAGLREWLKMTKDRYQAWLNRL